MINTCLFYCFSYLREVKLCHFKLNYLHHKRGEDGAIGFVPILSDSLESREHFSSENIFQNSKTRKLSE